MVQLLPKPTKPDIWNLPFFLRKYSKTCDLRTILISFCIVSLVLRRANKRVFSCSSKNRWNPRKNRSKLFCMTYFVESVVCRLAGSCMSGHLPAVLTDLSWKNDLPGSKAVTVLGREVTNICVCAFKVGSFGSLLSRSFFQLTWLRTAGKWPLMQEPANRHMTDSTENVVQNNFYRFFSRISAILLEQLKTRIFAHRGTRETMLKEIRIVRRSQVLLYEWRKYGKFQILGLIGVPGKGVVTQMVRVEVHESRPGLVNLDQGLFVRTRVGPFGTGPSVIFGSKILKLSFLSLKSSRTF